MDSLSDSTQGTPPRASFNDRAFAALITLTLLLAVDGLVRVAIIERGGNRHTELPLFISIAAFFPFRVQVLKWYRSSPGAMRVTFGGAVALLLFLAYWFRHFAPP